VAKYREIQDYVKKEYGLLPKSCWIAHVKEMTGLQPRISHRRYDPNVRQEPCPPNKVEPIKKAFRHFGMI
jgi:hypothetical protein